MRTIKFRGKRCRDGKWVYGFYCEATSTWKGSHPHKSWIIGCAKSNGGWFALQGATAVIDDTVGQFTGMTDKNGSEIYEGDILRVYYYGKSKVFGVVAFNESRYYIDDEFMRKELKAKVPMAEIFSHYRFEVVGNIHDNPELLDYHSCNNCAHTSTPATSARYTARWTSETS